MQREKRECDVCTRVIEPGEDYYVVNCEGEHYNVCEDRECMEEFVVMVGHRDHIYTQEEIDAIKGDMKYHAMVDEQIGKE